MVNIGDTFSRLCFTPEWKKAYKQFRTQKSLNKVTSFVSSLFSGKKKR